MVTGLLSLAIALCSNISSTTCGVGEDATVFGLNVLSVPVRGMAWLSFRLNNSATSRVQTAFFSKHNRAQNFTRRTDGLPSSLQLPMTCPCRCNLGASQVENDLINHCLRFMTSCDLQQELTPLTPTWQLCCHRYPKQTALIPDICTRASDDALHLVSNMFSLTTP